MTESAQPLILIRQRSGGTDNWLLAVPSPPGSDVYEVFASATSEAEARAYRQGYVRATRGLTTQPESSPPTITTTTPPFLAGPPTLLTPPQPPANLQMPFQGTGFNPNESLTLTNPELLLPPPNRLLDVRVTDVPTPPPSPPNNSPPDHPKGPAGEGKPAAAKPPPKQRRAKAAPSGNDE